MMSKTRFDQIWSGLNGVARKVYDEVPHGTAWSTKQICSAIQRNGAPLTISVVAGCLDALRRAGLIKQVDTGFLREPVRKAPAKKLADLKTVLESAPTAPTPEPAKVPMTPPKTAPAPTLNVVDTIGNLAQQMAAMAARHKQEMEDLAHLISDVAIEVQGQLETNDADLAKWRQMQALLKGI